MLNLKMIAFRPLFCYLFLICIIHPTASKKDLTDLEIEKLYDQWEATDEDPLPLDEVEPHKAPPPNIDPNDPEKTMQLLKKGKPVMAFVNVAGNPSRSRTEELTHRWQIGLQNAHVRVQRFIIEDNRALFLFEDGMQAFEKKDFLLQQPELSEYSIDGKTWQGKGYPVEYPHANQAKDGKPTDEKSTHQEL